MSSSIDLRQEALNLAGVIRHTTDLIASCEEDIRAYRERTDRGGVAVLKDAQERLGQAKTLRDECVTRVAASTNPHMPQALKVYGISR